MKAKLFREIGKIVGRTHSSIQRVINNYTSSKSIISKPRSGRPSKLTACEKRYVFKSVRLNPRISGFQIANEVRDLKTLHEDTIRKILKKAGYHGRVARRKPHISAVNRQKRLHFANDDSFNRILKHDPCYGKAHCPFALGWSWFVNWSTGKFTCVREAKSIFEEKSDVLNELAVIQKAINFDGMSGHVTNIGNN
ncbi:HTH_Tnp_Tc3_2 domain-containing protein [Caerostris extrusa]|uniref:HTH_Tnp_Tc3_2 domain-containing protein n=1 Tax=Caerostris extrusa TaxID=172846 RepID=A0AAV4UV70_CAEEX|nr:HTH_Tnp_Tc3_2 domain-containing protein [Caerostris extrusa]